MSIQRVLCLLSLSVLSLPVLSQESTPQFSQAFGLSGSHARVGGYARVVNGSNTNESSFNLRLRTYGLTYLARYDVLHTDGLSLSVGSSVTAGWSVSRKYRSTDIINGTPHQVGDSIKGTHFAFDIPVFVDLNFGLLSAADESKRKIGFYVGAGYAYSYTRIRLSQGIRPWDGFEPVFRAGIRLGRAWQSRWSLNFSMRYKKAEGSSHPYVLRILKEL